MDIVSILLILAGIGLLILEMFLPGFGLPGISGAVLTIVGVVLFSDTILEGLIVSLIVLTVLGVAFSIAIHSAARGRLAKSKLVLDTVATEPDKENLLSYYEGREGVTVTRLNPVGSAEFEGARLSVLSDSGFIESGVAVKAVRVEGKRIYVRPV